MKTLIIAPHMDDEAISCGGLIRKRIDEGHQVHVLGLYGRKYGRMSDDAQDASDEEEKKDFERSCSILGVTKAHSFCLDEGEPHQTGYYTVLELIEHWLKGVDPAEV